MKSNTNLYIYFLAASSFCLGMVDILLALQGKEVSGSTEAIWGSVFLFTTVLWAYYDADRSDFSKPFDFGLFIYTFWPVALPWYLIRTRGVKGVLMFFGFWLLWHGPRLAGQVVNAVFPGE